MNVVCQMEATNINAKILMVAIFVNAMKVFSSMAIERLVQVHMIQKINCLNFHN